MVKTGRKKGKCNIKCNILKRGPNIIYIIIYIYIIFIKLQIVLFECIYTGASSYINELRVPKFYSCNKKSFSIFCVYLGQHIVISP